MEVVLEMQWTAFGWKQFQRKLEQNKIRNAASAATYEDTNADEAYRETSTNTSTSIILYILKVRVMQNTSTANHDYSWIIIKVLNFGQDSFARHAMQISISFFLPFFIQNISAQILIILIPARTLSDCFKTFLIGR